MCSPQECVALSDGCGSWCWAALRWRAAGRPRARAAAMAAWGLGAAPGPAAAVAGGGGAAGGAALADRRAAPASSQPSLGHMYSTQEIGSLLPVLAPAGTRYRL
jgi:hypothetical protein